ncbi:hypothetical protein M7I_1587 [Glarea lozoyensis 74030]|uniref:Uncharacterized protein n=1 Tax=Glarea lozoyensis (strain ATCC 74030 / MF5533) TaxID=1104152 RepID=H0EGH1_GLAL7|nr:hypothetical protein M7I_1587 [Glarea lozoyensis 74030]
MPAQEVHPHPKELDIDRTKDSKNAKSYFHWPDTPARKPESPHPAPSQIKAPEQGQQRLELVAGVAPGFPLEILAGVCGLPVLPVEHVRSGHRILVFASPFPVVLGLLHRALVFLSPGPGHIPLFSPSLV